MLIGIVSFNSSKVILKCLNKLAEQSSTGFKIIILDNASDDNTIDLVRQNFPHIQIIASPENLGFGKAHNKILHHLEPHQSYLCLNPDVALEENFIEISLKLIQLHPKEALTGFIKDGNNAIYSTGQMMWIDLRPQCRDFLKNHPQLKENIYAANGAAAVYTWEYIQASLDHFGYFFNPNFFLYCEDDEVGLRMERLGYSVRYCNELIAAHNFGSSNAMSHFKCWKEALFNRFQLQVLHSKGQHLFLYISLYFLSEVVYILPYFKKEKQWRFKIVLLPWELIKTFPIWYKMRLHFISIAGSPKGIPYASGFFENLTTRITRFFKKF